MKSHRVLVAAMLTVAGALKHTAEPYKQEQVWVKQDDGSYESVTPSPPEAAQAAPKEKIFVPYTKCRGQDRFNIMMCTSHMCTKCTLAWCMKACQKVQTTFSDCRCEDWPEARKSYSGGDYEHKGKFGDVGDYEHKGKFGGDYEHKGK